MTNNVLIKNTDSDIKSISSDDNTDIFNDDTIISKIENLLGAVKSTGFIYDNDENHFSDGETINDDFDDISASDSTNINKIKEMHLASQIISLINCDDQKQLKKNIDSIKKLLNNNCNIDNNTKNNIIILINKMLGDLEKYNNNNKSVNIDTLVKTESYNNIKDLASTLHDIYNDIQKKTNINQIELFNKYYTKIDVNKFKP